MELQKEEKQMIWTKKYILYTTAQVNDEIIWNKDAFADDKNTLWF